MTKDEKVLAALIAEGVGAQEMIKGLKADEAEIKAKALKLLEKMGIKKFETEDGSVLRIDGKEGTRMCGVRDFTQSMAAIGLDADTINKMQEQCINQTSSEPYVRFMMPKVKD